LSVLRSCRRPGAPPAVIVVSGEPPAAIDDLGAEQPMYRLEVVG
jgi:hypothetical protein